MKALLTLLQKENLKNAIEVVIDDLKKMNNKELDSSTYFVLNTYNGAVVSDSHPDEGSAIEVTGYDLIQAWSELV